ncbi:hypothetical protein LOTGIDRAFT_170155 [Lottia gigantea]|uniref:Sushi domain-containing protein n=1 Tax=Lottia gigantea TaxID=225164 RepID=V3ZDW4_LOTGI|nr:hypothetical protein LOTGIDRAFT_170155 [Lottia gigantea]ESO82242.1 hypothetical protein LOTGIDRAFT_170155 [Lottia gigantea]
MLTSTNVAPRLVSGDAVKELRLSTYNRTPGTVVNLGCYNNYTLVGTDQITCSQAGEWSYYTKPYCSSPQGNQLSELHKLLLGVGVGAAVLFVFVLIGIIGALIYRSKQRRKRARRFRHPSTVTLAYSDFDGYRPFGIISPFSYDDREFFPDGSVKPVEKVKPSQLVPRSALTSSRTSQNTSRPTSPKVTINGPLPEFRSRSRSVDGVVMAVPVQPDPRELERLYSTTLPNKLKRPSYSGEWKDRQEYKRMDYFNRHALAEGHDPFLWRPGSTRWIFERKERV